MLTETYCVNLPRSIVTDHYLLGPMLIISPKILEEGTLGPANNLWPIGLGRYARHALGIIPGETYREPL